MFQSQQNQPVTLTATRHYFSRSIALLRQDRGWIKPLLVLAAIQLVPVAGQLFLLGYVMEWARLIAWDFDAAPKQKEIQIVECLKSGWRSFISSILWLLVGIVITTVITSFFVAAGFTLVPSLLSIAIQTLAAVIAGIAALHASIYQKFSAGYRFGRIFSMCKRDIAGIIRIGSISISLSFIIMFIFGIAIAFVFNSVQDKLLIQYPLLEYWDTIETITITQLYDLTLSFILLLRTYVPVLAVLCYLLTIALVFKECIVMSSTGLWMRQFFVSHWGRIEEPLPLPQPLDTMR